MLGELIGGLASAGVNWFQGERNRESQERLAAQNIALQREFAQSGIQWKVADAKAAGLHPLAALGTQTTGFSPVSVGSTDFGSMGQDIGRAVKAALSQEDRDAEELKQLTLERARLQNDALRADIAGTRAATQSRQGGQLGPAMPNGSVPNTWQDFVLGGRAPSRSPEGLALGDKKQEQNEMPNTEFRWHRPFGYPLKVNQWFDDAQATTNRLGESELLETLKAIVNLGADHVSTAGHLFGTRWGNRRPRAAPRYVRSSGGPR